MQPDGRNEPAATDVSAFVLPGLLDDVDSWRIVVDQDTFSIPRPPEVAAGLVPVPADVRIERTGGEFEGDHVVRLDREKELALLGSDDVIGWCRERAEIGTRLVTIQACAERANE
jgi:hypothetical protein